MESKSLNNSILAEELLSVALLEDGEGGRFLADSNREYLTYQNFNINCKGFCSANSCILIFLFMYSTFFSEIIYY